MSAFMRKAALVVGAVALVAATAGAAAPLLAPGIAGAAGIAGVASAATLTAIGTYGGLAAGVLTAISTATAPGMSSQGSQTSFTTNPQSGLPYAMGRTRMSGLRIYAKTNTRPGYTKFNDLLWFGVLLSIGGAIGGIEKFTADNEIVTFDASGNAIGDYHDYQGQKIHLGGQQTSALALTLGGGSAPGWSSAHKLSGITHAMWCLRYNKQGEMYGAGAPEPAWIGNWVKVYDPRLDSTYPGGSGSCRALVESTYVWSDNPGLHALTWALGRWQNGKRTCGIGAPVANIRVAEFVECANVCEANGWKVGGVEWTTDSKWDTLKRILQSGGAIPTQTGAMVGCLVSTPRTAIATIESRHLLDSLSIAATKSRRDRFNSVIPRYVDEDSDWSVISGTAITVSDYVTADKGQRTKEIDYPLVQVFSGQVAKQPGQLAAYDIVNSREAGPINFTTGPEWIGLKTGDVILLNVPEEGLVNQPVLITRRAPDPSTGKVAFSAQTETYAKHAYALGQSTTPPAPFSLTAPDLKPPAPAAANWAAAGTVTGEGLPAIVVTGNSEMPSADAVLIDYKLPADAAWTRSAILSANEPVQHVIAPLQSETAYQVRVGYRVEQIDGDFTILAAVTTGVGIISDISDTIGEQRDELDKLQLDTAAAAAAAAAAQSQIAAIEGSVSADFTAIHAEVDALQNEATAVQGSIVALQSADSAIQQSVGLLQNDLASALGSIGTINGEIDGLQSQAAGIVASVSGLGDQIVALGGDINTIETVQASHGSSISTLQQTASNQAGQLAQISTDLSTANANISLNAQAISSTNGNVASLSSTVQAQGGQISSLQQVTSAQGGTIAQIQVDLTTTTAGVIQNAQAISTTNGSVASLSSTVSAQGSSISSLQSASSSQAGQIATLTTQVSAGGGNLLPNTDFAANTVGWLAYWNGQGAYNDGRNLLGDDWRPPNENVWVVAQDDANTYYYASFFIANRIPVDPNKWYEWSAYIGAHRCFGNILVQFYDRNGTMLAAHYGTGYGPANYDGRLVGSYARPFLKMKPPAGAATAGFAVEKGYTAEGNNSYTVILRPQMKEVFETSLSPTAYSVGNAGAVILQQANALSTLTTSFASLETRVSSAEGSVSSLSQSLTSANGSISSLQTSVNSLNGSVSTLQQSSSTQAGQISTLLSTVSSQGATISSNSTAISTLNGSVASLNSVVTASSNPNICPNGGFENGLRGWSAGGQNPTGWNVYTFVWGYYVGNIGYAGSTGNYTYLDSARFPIAGDGNSYTQSFDVDFQGSAGSYAYGEMVWLDSANNVITGTGTPFIYPRSFDVSGNSRMRHTHVSPPGAVSAWSRVVFYTPAGGNIVGVHFRQMKVEFGSVATPYSGEATAGQMYQAYSDLNGSFASLSSTVSSQGGSIATLQQSYTGLNGTVSSLSSTVSAQGSSISSLQTATSTLQGDAATLRTQVTASNPNLCPGFEKGTAGWTANAFFYSGPAADAWGPYVGTNSPVADSGQIILYREIPALAGSPYTLTGDMGQIINGGTGAHYFVIEPLDAAGNQTGAPANGVPRASGVSFDATGASREALKVTLVAPVGTTRLRIYAVWLKQSGTVQNFHVRQVKLERGAVATPYSAETTITQTFEALSTLDSQYASLSSTVSTQGGSISQNATSISNLSGTVSTLSSTVSTQGGQISNLQSVTSTLQGNVATLTTAVNAGSPNILSYGGFANGLLGWTTQGSWYVSNFNDPSWGRYASAVSVESAGDHYASSEQIPAVVGNYYTITADIDRGGTSGGYCFARIVWLNSSGGVHSIGPAVVGTGSFTNDFSQRQKVTGMAPSGAAAFYVQLGVEGSFTPGNISFRQIKVANGTSVGSFTDEATVSQSFQALSTLNSQYASLNSTVATQGVSISTQATAITTLNGNVATLFGQYVLDIDVNGRVAGMKLANNGSASSIIFRADLVRFEDPDPGTGAMEWKDQAIQMRDGAGKLRIFMGYRA